MIHRLLARECHRPFADEGFGDLFEDVGRRSISPRIVAVVMVLQRLKGLSERETVVAQAFDLRWKYAAGALEFDHRRSARTVLVDMRARLRESARPDRISEGVLAVGRRTVRDSKAPYGAVATQDAGTMIRPSTCSLLRVSPEGLRAGVEANVKVQRPSPPRKVPFSREAFVIDPRAETATCPNGVVAPLRRSADGSSAVAFGRACSRCPSRDQCSRSPSGRALKVACALRTTSPSWPPPSTSPDSQSSA